MTGKNIAVIGASGGIGRALVMLYANQDDVDKIYAFSRTPQDLDHEKIITRTIDITLENTIENAANMVEGELDIIIVATGILHGHDLTPEKGLKDLNISAFEKVFAINCYGPALVAKHFIPLLPKNRHSIFAALSARVGSISDNYLGGWYAYRASKSALNMIIKNTAIEVGRNNKNACIIGLHPGTVDTSLSKPFQGAVKKDKLFAPDYSAEQLISVINDITVEQSGKIFAWDGAEIPA